jgi:U11/U12 small nuclear ribonucleoprotein SNRNP20
VRFEIKVKYLEMVKRYYCDFCDKTYPYNTINRKKHNEGIQHQTLRLNYYRNFKSKF